MVKRQVELSGENLTDAQPSFQDNQPVVSFRLDNAGARKFGKITQENVGKPFAIVLDDKVISAPNIREPILGGSRHHLRQLHGPVGQRAGGSAARRCLAGAA